MESWKLKAKSWHKKETIRRFFYFALSVDRICTKVNKVMMGRDIRINPWDIDASFESFRAPDRTVQ